MPQTEWVGDNVVIKISGGNLASEVNIESEFKMVKVDITTDAIETTRGPDQSDKSFVPGMMECPVEITLGINLNDIMPEHLQADQLYTLYIAPDTDTAGKPLHEGEYFLSSNALEIEAGRSERQYQTQWKQHSIITNIHRGGVVPGV